MYYTQLLHNTCITPSCYTHYTHVLHTVDMHTTHIYYTQLLRAHYTHVLTQLLHTRVLHTWPHLAVGALDELVEDVEVALTLILVHDSRLLQQVVQNHTANGRPLSSKQANSYFHSTSYNMANVTKHCLSPTVGYTAFTPN